MTDMLLVSTCQVHYPILRFILKKTDDLALHGGLVCSCPDRWITTMCTQPCMGTRAGDSVANFHLSRFRVCSPSVAQGDKRGRATMAVSFKGAHFPQDIILMGVCWYVAYPLSTRHVEDLMLERSVHVEHRPSTAG